VQDLHREIDRRVTAAGGRIDGWYYCPHHPEAPRADYRRDCDCRKPRPGLIERAARDLHLDPARSFVVGDKWGDVGLARAVGARALLVRTGTGAIAEQRPRPGVAADVVVDNLAAAASWILMRC
jgi:D-glycero-D-manno-heptose 1,7-bisphosphate phosphatase